MRPRFKIDLPVAPDDALARVTAPIRDRDARLEGLIAGTHVEWMVPREERHFWSPRLSLEVTPGEDDRTSRLRGLFGPRPSVWTLFAFGYGGLAFIAVTALFFGASQWSIDEAPWALWALPFCGVGAIALYLFSLVGQRLAADEIEGFRRLLAETLDSPEAAAAPPPNPPAAEA